MTRHLPFLAALLFSVSARAADHPLDPLDGPEISSAVAAVRSKSAGFSFPDVSLAEPAKADMLAWAPGQPWTRRARVVGFDRFANKTYEGLVELPAGKLAAWKELPGVQPNVMFKEFEELPAVVRADPRWVAAMKKRGITDLDGVMIDIWASGPMTPVEQALGKRLLRGLCYRSAGTTNPYARPIEGVVILIDANSRTVLSVTDTGVVPVAPEPGGFDAASVPAERPGLKPLEISQPGGVSFTRDGYRVRWQGWEFRWALQPREGPVLYQVCFEDGGKCRSILYRASLADMLVPYGDPDGNWSFRNAFDEGEYGIGRMAGPLEPNRDVPANAQFVDATFAGDFGNSYKLERAVALYERDGGILWKHNNLLDNRSESRRARELVLSFVATISNYDYAINWVFGQDGTLSLEAHLTGIMLAKGVDPAAKHPHHGHLVAPGVVAPHHQHFFSFRLDFDVDGAANTVLESDVGAMSAGKDNPFMNAMLMEDTPLVSEKAAQRDMSLALARKWKVQSSEVKNPLGEPTSYALVPGENSVPYLDPHSSVRRRGQFVNHHLWVTAFNDAERYSAGVYPNQGGPGEGLPKFIADDQPLVGKDVVVWYTFGVTHIPRPEDWPVMPVHKTGFKLLPVGFFPRNPALDIR